MKHLFAPLGFVLLLLTATGVHAQSLGGLQIYENMHSVTLKEVALEGVDEQIINYVVQLADQENMIPKGKTAADMKEAVKAAFETRLDDFCEKYAVTYDACPQTYQMFRDWGRDIIETRTLSTDLLHIATGYETGVMGGMGDIFTIAERTLTIRNLWRSQDDALLTPEVFPLIRAVPRPDSITDGMFDDLGAELKKYVPNAVWRYRYGIAAFDKEPCRETQGSTELFEAIEERSCAVEEKLRALRDALPAAVSEFDPMLQRGEIVIFPLRRLDDPAHVIVWMMAENVNGEVVRDVGLGWDLMLESVPIGILGGAPCDTDKLGEAYCTVVDNYMVRPGGRYEDPPKEPGADEGGLCQLPFARDGYLCRPMRPDRCNAEIPDKDPKSIVLAECKPTQAKQPVAITASGPDVCRTGWWRIPLHPEEMSKDTAEEDPDLRPGHCSNCVVDIVCSESCGGIDGFDSETQLKDENGIIKICLSRKNHPSLLASGLIHELIHAQQLCPLRREDTTIDDETCCALEAEAYRASCRILDTNGILERANVSIDECIGAGANKSCERYGKTICSSLDTETIWNKLMAIAQKDTSSYLSCDELVSDMANKEPIAAAMKEGMNGACTPGCQTKYENTIGNNLCYVGQCIEQSIEQSRVIPGRMALVVGDESYPWDSCAVDDSQAGGLITLPAVSPPLTPAYNPRLLVESLDRALCQLNGLPAQTPPILCQFNYQRRLNIPTSDYVSTALSFAAQIEENDIPTMQLQRMTQSIAARIGSSLLTRYLSWAGSALSDTLRTANQLLNSMEKTQFPLETCPRQAVEKPDFCSASSSPSE
ncbi:MAG: hypothetical protein PHX87_00380 [Candidatus Peribacteraceae bacterium]|nr:hypothetical protein [Candidatus Peribacteraceae bacterium]MDD5741864.1 hypothetical protein [Candidatus Peribacteraceae bacterium]